MQTALILYIVFWFMVIVPLVLFNLKRIRVKNSDGSGRIKWGFLSAILAIAVLLTVFICSSYQMTVRTRYELAAERFVEYHAKYLTGHLSYEEYIAETAALRGGSEAPSQEVLDVPGVDLLKARFQIGDWMTPSKYDGVEGFPETVVLNTENNPVFLFYTVDNGTETSVFLVRMESDSNGQNWLFTYQGVVPEEIVSNSSFNSFKPNAKNGKWFEIAA